MAGSATPIGKSCEGFRMTASGLGCAKTPAVAPHVEISLSNCICGSQIILHKRRSMPCRRIVFSTFRGCMSFYTGSVKLGHAGDVRCMTVLPPKADVHPRSLYVAFCQQETLEPMWAVDAQHIPNRALPHHL